MFAILRAILIIVCVVIMAVPLFKGPASRKKHYYLVRRVYSKEFRGMPYLVPNRSMVITLGELGSTVVYLVTACLSYMFYKAETMPRGMPLPFWFALSYLPSLIGIWLAGWGLLHACLCDVEGKSNKSNSWIFTPFYYNFMWMSGTFILIIVNLFWLIKVHEGWDTLEVEIIRIIQEIARGADAWDVDHDYFKFPLAEVLAQRVTIYVKLGELTSTIQVFAAFRILFSSVLALFYLGTARYLIRLCSDILALRVRDTVAPPGQFVTAVWTELEKEFQFLSRLSVVITVFSFGQVALWIYEIQSASRYVEMRTKLTLVLVDQIGGVLATPALLFQSWRIVTERYSADESEFQHVREESQKQEIPHMVAQLLQWDSTEHWGARSEVELGNFPGIGEVDQKHLVNQEHLSLRSKRKDLAMGISILRTTVVTEDKFHTNADI